MKYPALILTIFTFLIASGSFAQSLKKSKYLVITFDKVQRPSTGIHQTFHWIVPTDSVKNGDFTLYPLYFENFSQTNLSDCMKGNKINIGASAVDKFDKAYLGELSSLKSLIKKNRIKMQTITKHWVNGYKEDVTIYATPISGNFCRCMIEPIKQSGDVKGLVV